MLPERHRRIRSVLERRQPDLTILMERIHKPHNLSAILRNCDAVGVLEVHAVLPEDGIRLHRDTAAGTDRWIEVRTHPGTREGVGTLQEQGHQVLAAHPGPGARDYRQVDMTRPTCFLVGAELHGLSDEALECADVRVAIPMVGMVRSLNVSVATSLLLFEAFRQRDQAGMYDRPRLDEDTLARLTFEWGYPRLAARYRKADRPYPRLDEDGRLIR